MNQINANNAAAINVADELAHADAAQSLLAARKQSEVQSISDWEMVMVGGGDTVVCW